jgi:hypothetical protein
MRIGTPTHYKEEEEKMTEIRKPKKRRKSKTTKFRKGSISYG